jgi:regulator of sigma E protease
VDARATDVFTRTGIESSEMYAAFVPIGTGEWKAGLRPGDRITGLDGVTESNWQVLQADLLHGPTAMHTLQWTREGTAMAGSIRFGLAAPLRATHWSPSATEHRVPNPSRFSYALSRGLEETARVIKIVVVGMLRIVQGRVSLAESVSGPVTLYDIAGQAGAQGASTFVAVMALVSINLGLINLLPIPVLDGGHLAFFVVEGVRRRAVARRTREIASLIGVTMLVVLMAIAFKNDLQHHWSIGGL